jgi:glycosyltransferase involved in cell wall biosynthesis
MQNVLFFSEEAPPYLPTLDKHYTLYAYTGPVSFERLSEIWQEKKPLAILTWRISRETYSSLSRAFIVRKRWVHFNDKEELPKTQNVVPTAMSVILGHRHDSQNPLMSAFTTTYKSGKKILRPLQSLQAQTYTNWEWILWDDSEGDETYRQLLDMARRDLRIRVFKAPQHSGYIGEMKRLAASVAYGSFLLEIDHDDDFHSNLFQWIKDAADKYPDAGFFYTNAAQLMEDTYKPATYGDFYGFGYAGHSFVWSDFHKQHVPQSCVAPPNPITLRHLVGMPNHVRVWRTEVYDRVGKHNPLLSVADDYDLMARTWAAGIKWCHIRVCGYYQYNNRDGNFTYIRNSLIQHCNREIYQRYLRDGKLPPCPSFQSLQPQWKTDEFMFPKEHYEYIPAEADWDVTHVVWGESGTDAIRVACEQLDPSGGSWRVFVFGQPDLKALPAKWWPRIMWWKLSSPSTVEERQRYFEKYVNTGKAVVWPTDPIPGATT